MSPSCVYTCMVNAATVAVHGGQIVGPDLFEGLAAASGEPAAKVQ